MTQRSRPLGTSKPSPTFVDASRPGASPPVPEAGVGQGFSLSVADPHIQELPVALYHRLVDSLANAA